MRKLALTLVILLAAAASAATKPPIAPIKCTDVACCQNPANGGGNSNCCQTPTDPCPIQ